MPVDNKRLLQLYPVPAQSQPLQGLYLSDALHRCLDNSQQVCIYTNYIVSLDGRIALAEHAGGDTRVPQALANPVDWRLYQELAAQADLLLTSGRYMRELAEGQAQDSLPISDKPEFADLRAWRQQRGLPAQPTVGVITASLDLPYEFMKSSLQHEVILFCGDSPPESKLTLATQYGFRVVRCANGGARVDGKILQEYIKRQAYHQVYAIAGPGILETLVRAGVLNRLYLTQVHRLLGGQEYDTLLETARLQPPAGFSLKALYLYTDSETGLEQMFFIYEAE
jgi:riboflavin biosynthesis pyrimidine reductase